jgi:hypothetical protein
VSQPNQLTPLQGKRQKAKGKPSARRFSASCQNSDPTRRITFLLIFSALAASGLVFAQPAGKDDQALKDLVKQLTDAQIGIRSAVTARSRS